MKLRQIEAYWAVMRSGSVTAAARMLNVSQPAVSKTLRHAEDQLGIKLFHRVHGRVVATPEAEALFPEVDTIFQRIESLQDQAGKLKLQQQGLLRVGASSTLATSVLPMAVRSFQKSFPRFRINAALLPAVDLAEKLRNNTIDIGLTLTPVRDPDIEITVIGQTRMACLLPNGHALAGRQILTPADLAPYPLITFGENTLFGKTLDEAFESMGVRRHIAIEVTLSMQAYLFVQSGCGVALVDTLMSKRNSTGVIWCQFEPPVTFPIYLLTSARRPLNTVGHRYCDMVRDALAELGHSLQDAVKPRSGKAKAKG